MCSARCWSAPWMPGLICVQDLVVGDVMVDRSVGVEGLRPLGLWWVAAVGWEPRKLRELAGSVIIEKGSALGSRAGQSAGRNWLERCGPEFA